MSHERNPQDGIVRGYVSSYDVTTFVVRQEKTMFISGNYDYDSQDLLMAAYCMVAHALKVAKRGLKLPRAREHWKGKPANPDGAGIVKLYVAHF